VEYNDKVDAIAQSSKDENGVYTIVDEMAIPPGGMQKFYEYVGSKLMYPAQARRLGVEGKVFVEFVVQTDGTITDTRVVKGIGAGCDEEARNVIASSPKWTPGKNKGVVVKHRMVMPISFALN
jgi:protein TonB